MTTDSLNQFLLLPELKLERKFRIGAWGIGFVVSKTSTFEVCPKCASKSSTVYDRRRVIIKDEPIRNKAVHLHIIKRRFYCKGCHKPFTEPINGIGKYKRMTERFKRGVSWACENFIDLKKVQKYYRCSARTVYTAHYKNLEVKRKQDVYALPKLIGIDEHSIRKPKYSEVEFATIVTDHSNRRVYDLIDGRDLESLRRGFNNINGKERVEAVSMDMSETYRSFVKQNLPNAIIVSDHFHVIRLFNKLINYYRKKLTGDNRTNPIRKLLVRNSRNLKPYERSAVRRWLLSNSEMREIYSYKEAMSRIFNMKGYSKARIALISLCDRMGKSKLKRVATLRKTLLRWREEILNFHIVKISNGRTEGFNRKAKLTQRRAYGYKSFKNYRLKLLSDCW